MVITEKDIRTVVTKENYNNWAAFDLELRKRIAYNHIRRLILRGEIKPMTKKRTPAVFLNDAFGWRDSTEGTNFWIDVHRRTSRPGIIRTEELLYLNSVPDCPEITDPLEFINRVVFTSW